MAVDIKLPGLGEGVDSGDVLEVFVSVGDMVEKNETLVELETDKATVNIPADIAGKITAIHVNEGDTVSVGSVMVSIEPSDAAAPAPAAPAPVSYTHLRATRLLSISYAVFCLKKHLQLADFRSSFTSAAGVKLSQPKIENETDAYTNTNTQTSTPTPPTNDKFSRPALDVNTNTVTNSNFNTYFNTTSTSAPTSTSTSTSTPIPPTNEKITDLL